MKTNLIIFGTRPELIKLIPVIHEIRKRSLEENFLLIHTGQHIELTASLLSKFSIKTDYTLNTANFNQPITLLLSKVITELQTCVSQIQKSHFINRIILQGDTASSYAAALIAFLNHIPCCHIEAGLRTNNLKSPFPEEYFRKCISVSAEMHFAPTAQCKSNLLKEGIPNERIIVTGNTIVDAINLARVKDMEHPTKNNVLITCHRRENLNGNFDSLIESIHQIATENRELKFIWVSHFNPIVREKLSRLKSHQLSNIEIKEPLDLDNFYELYAQTKIIITDSGGIQEEAVSFKIPVVIIRNNTERVESINAGISKIAGTSYSDLKNAFHWGLNKQISNQDSLYGDGKAAVRIVDYLQNNL